MVTIMMIMAMNHRADQMNGDEIVASTGKRVQLNEFERRMVGSWLAMPERENDDHRRDGDNYDGEWDVHSDHKMNPIIC